MFFENYTRKKDYRKLKKGKDRDYNFVKVKLIRA